MSRKTLLLVIAIGSLAAAAVVTARAFQSSGAKEPWPAFTMTYRLTGGNQDGQIWRLNYARAHQWHQDLIEDPRHPSSIGSWEEFSGNVHTTYNASVQSKESE